MKKYLKRINDESDHQGLTLMKEIRNNLLGRKCLGGIIDFSLTIHTIVVN